MLGRERRQEMAGGAGQPQFVLRQWVLANSAAKACFAELAQIQSHIHFCSVVMNVIKPNQSEGSNETLPKAQRTRGLSSYHKFFKSSKFQVQNLN